MNDADIAYQEALKEIEKTWVEHRNYGNPP
jgi:hypothetical protein